MKRRTFTPEFKREAVRQLEVGEKSPSDLANELGIPRNKLYRWQEEINISGKAAFPGRVNNRKSKDKLSAENAQLKKELAQAKEENEILKKAAAFFARDLK